MAQVTLYALSTCIHCKNAKKFLEDSNVAFECVFVDAATGEERRSLMDTVRKHNPRCSFPTLVINGGDRVIVGFHKEDIKEALNI